MAKKKSASMKAAKKAPAPSPAQAHVPTPEQEAQAALILAAAAERSSQLFAEACAVLEEASTLSEAVLNGEVS